MTTKDQIQLVTHKIGQDHHHVRHGTRTIILMFSARMRVFMLDKYFGTCFNSEQIDQPENAVSAIRNFEDLKYQVRSNTTFSQLRVQRRSGLKRP